MLKIYIPDFIVEKILEWLRDDGTRKISNELIKDWLESHIVIGGDYLMQFIVNNKKLLGDKLAYSIHQNLRIINNEFYKILTTGSIGTIYFDAGSGYETQRLTVRINNTVIIFNAINENLINYDNLIKGENLHPFQNEVRNEEVNLIQAIEEVRRIVNNYKNVCKQILDKATPNVASELMKTMFGANWVFKEPWLPLEQEWLAYRKKHNITDEDVKRALTKAKEEEKAQQKAIKPWWKIF